jgi:hypothetical protein
MPLDLGQLLRLRGMIESAATSVEPDGDGASALTQSYMRLRGLVSQLVEESGATHEEFNAAFPEIEEIKIEGHQHPREMAMRPMKYAPQAREAKALLGQLAGWVSGLIDELEHEHRSEGLT